MSTSPSHIAEQSEDEPVFAEISLLVKMSHLEELYNMTREGAYIKRLILNNGLISPGPFMKCPYQRKSRTRWIQKA